MKPRYDPARHHRRSIRLRGYDYAQRGAYFVTIVTHGRELLFNDPLLRSVAETKWQRIPGHFPHVELDEWVVMPNHLHGIIVIVDHPGRGEASQATPSPSNVCSSAAAIVSTQTSPGDASPLRCPAALRPGSLGAIVGNFKSITARRINRLRHAPGLPVWQRNYWEHIVRTERSLDAIRRYIAGNPARWEWGRYHPTPAGPDPRAADLWRLLQGDGR